MVVLLHYYNPTKDKYYIRCVNWLTAREREVGEYNSLGHILVDKIEYDIMPKNTPKTLVINALERLLYKLKR